MKNELEMDQVDHLVEIRGVHDGWAFAVMKDGSIINRWDQDDPRYAPTQEVINAQSTK